MESATAMWNKSLPLLKKNMTEVSYDTWISSLIPICIDDTELVLMAKDSEACSVLKKLYITPVSRLVSKANDNDMTVTYIEPGEEVKYSEKIQEQAMLPSEERDFTLNPKYTFDTFVIGKSNEFAHAAAKAVSEDPGKVYNPLFLYGGVGLGKTHLMHAIGNHVKSVRPKAKIIYVTSETFTNEVIRAIQENRMEKFRTKYRRSDILMVDDIQFIAGRVSTQEEFFNTFNALHAAGKHIVLSSDRPPMELTTLEERLRSRFEGGLIVDIQPPDVDTRVAILKKKAQLENIEVADEVLFFIAEKVNSNIRQLEGSLTRVIAYSRLISRPINLQLADTALKDIIPGYKNRMISIPLIQQIVADYYGIDVQSLLSPRKTSDITFPRQVAMYLCKEMTDSTWKEIGSSFGGRDHSTVVSAHKKIKSEMMKDTELLITIEDLRKRIKK